MKPTEDVSAPFLDPIEKRADARVIPFASVTPEERFNYFDQMGYRPQGLFFPDDPEMLQRIKDALARIALIEDDDNRLYAYNRLQDQCIKMSDAKVPGRWSGQQAVARSKAQFRLVTWGRRGGKTYHAAREGFAVAFFRPRSLVWVCGPTMDAAGRCFAMMKTMIQDMGVTMTICRDTKNDKLIELPNGSRIEGVSLENVGDVNKKSGSAVGAAVDLAIVDEAAQVTPAAWTRTILPPLADRHGQALLLGSWEGEDEFFFAKAQEARKEALSGDGQSDWDVFQAASYDVNFRVFPQGRKSPAIVRAQKESADPLEFLEQYGAIASASRTKVYPQFKERVHVGKFPVDPNHPITLVVDPSFGSNPYAVLAFQDFHEYLVVVDEFYRERVMAEEVSADIRSRWWSSLVTDVVVDSAQPIECERWQRLEWPAYPVNNKPQIPERLPLHRMWLRDPSLFKVLYRQTVNEILQERDLPPDSDEDMLPEEQKIIIMEVEERLSDDRLTPENIRYLRQCARLFISDICVNTIDEHKKYRYPPSPRQAHNPKELPIDAHNHALDCCGYMLWQFKRFEGDAMDQTPYSTLNVVRDHMNGPLTAPRPKEAEVIEVADHANQIMTQQDRMRFLLRGVREEYRRSASASPRSFLKRA